MDYVNGTIHAIYPTLVIRIPRTGKDFQGNDFQTSQDLLQGAFIKNPVVFR
jgi:hypothetical protein